jgi:hypothetical protein
MVWENALIYNPKWKSKARYKTLCNILACACTPSTQETKTEESQVLDQLGLHKESLSQKS